MALETVFGQDWANALLEELHVFRRWLLAARYLRGNSNIAAVLAPSQQSLVDFPAASKTFQYSSLTGRS
jgi:hypothetical protein